MAKRFRRKAMIKKMPTLVADIADAKILCNKKVVSMSGNVGFEWEYKIKLTTLFYK
jgi:hypothetical protein